MACTALQDLRAGEGIEPTTPGISPSECASPAGISVQVWSRSQDKMTATGFEPASPYPQAETLTARQIVLAAHIVSWGNCEYISVLWNSNALRLRIIMGSWSFVFVDHTLMRHTQNYRHINDTHSSCQRVFTGHYSCSPHLLILLHRVLQIWCQATYNSLHLPGTVRHQETNNFN